MIPESTRFCDEFQVGIDIRFRRRQRVSPTKTSTVMMKQECAGNLDRGGPRFDDFGSSLRHA